MQIPLTSIEGSISSSRTADGLAHATNLVPGTGILSWTLPAYVGKQPL